MNSERVAQTVAGFFSTTLLVLVLSPIVQNWRAKPRDGFPLSYYPMFTTKRPAVYRLPYFVGRDANGERIKISYRLAGSGGLNQIRRQLNKIVRSGADEEIAAFCRSVATNIAESNKAHYRDVVEVRIIVGEYRLDDYFSAGVKTPLREEVVASCVVEKES